jgi:hypothetical protein
MNQNNRESELAIDNLAMMLEALEEYIRRADYFSNFTKKEQFFRRTIPDNEGTLENDEDLFFSQLYIFYALIINGKSKSYRQAVQKEYHKWIDAVKIKPDECPEKLKHFLIEIDEILENRGDKFYRARSEESKKFELDLENNPEHRQLPVKILSGLQEAMYRQKKEVKINGNAEAGRETLQQIRNSTKIRHEDWVWTFPFLQDQKEQSQPKNQISPKEAEKPELILDTFEDILRTVELYIQKLNYYPDWKVSELTGEGEDYLLKNWKDKSTEEIKDKILQVDFKCIFLTLKTFKQNDPSYYPNLVSELKVKFLQWQNKRKLNSLVVPSQLKEVLFTINEVLEGSWNWKKNQENGENNEGEQEEIIKIIANLKLEIAELTKKYKIDLGFQFNDWEKKLMLSKDISEAKAYQQQIEKRIAGEKAKHQPLTTNENKLSLPVKIALGTGIIILVLGAIIITYRVIRKQKK